MYTLSSSAAAKRLTTQNNLAELHLVQKLSMLEKQHRWSSSSLERDRKDAVILLDHIRQSRFESIFDSELNDKMYPKRIKNGKMSTHGCLRQAKSAPPCDDNLTFLSKRPVSAIPVIPFHASLGHGERVITESTRRASSMAIQKTQTNPTFRGDNFDQRMKVFLNSLPARNRSSEWRSGLSRHPSYSPKYYRSKCF